MSIIQKPHSLVLRHNEKRANLTLADLVVVVLMLWGLAGGLLYLYRRRMVNGEGWFLLFLGGLLAFGAWRTASLQPLSLAIPGIGPAVVTIIPQVMIPVVYLSVLFVYFVEGASTAAWLILGLLGVQFLVGSLAPFVMVLTSGLRLFPGINLADVSSGIGLRASLAQVMALGVGMYLMIVAYQLLANRLEQRWAAASTWVSLIVSGLVEGALFAFGATWGTGAWPGALIGELAGWTLAGVSLWPVMAIYLSHLGADTWPGGRPPTRPPLGVLNQTFALQNALRESQARVVRLDAGLRVLTEARSVIVRSDRAGYMLEEICRRLARSGYVQLAWVVLSDGQPGGQSLAASAGQPMKFLETIGTGQALSPGLQMAEAAIKNSAPHVVQDTEDLSAREAWGEEAARCGLRSLATLPIHQSGTHLGVLCVGKKSPDGFDDEVLGLLAGVADDVAYGLRRLALERQSARRIHELDTLYELGMDLVSEHGVPALLQKLIDRSVRLLDAEGGAVFQCDPAQRSAECVATSQDGDVYAESRVDYGVGLVGQAAEDGRIYNERRSVDGCGPANSEQAFLVVPLKWQRDVKGVVLVMRPPGKPFTSDDQDLLGLMATQAAVALENARLIEIERRRSDELEALREASLRMTSNLDLNSVLEAILEHALKLISAWDAHIFLYDGERLQFAAALWAGDVQGSPFSEPRQNGLTYMVARTGKRLVVEDASSDPLFLDAVWDGAIVGIPLRSKTRNLGCDERRFQGSPSFPR